MDSIYDLLGSMSDMFKSVEAYLLAIPDMFDDLLAHLHYWYIKGKLTFALFFIELSYNTAKVFLNEIGFNRLIETSFNALPDELRYYAFLFKVPDAITLYMNCLSTALVMRLSRW
ncbi:DUF2523 family protein [Vibrio tapetis]|uniref:Accessory cholera enterotoxin n=1 Tax=Vibrio tapetis subsp. tapetis TaxID=1671868 RepID=A0A2N8Z9P4_9VIBR|nr:DUF2523 family protein [Vibrio tapetis]SON48620.1 Accessory cholera enterotoxin [Vibrio tapetis subsp. tapetis]